MMNYELHDITSTYNEMLKILNALNVEYDSFDGGYCSHDEWGNEIQICPVIYVTVVKGQKVTRVVFEFDFDGTNGYYFIENRN